MMGAAAGAGGDLLYLNFGPVEEDAMGVEVQGGRLVIRKRSECIDRQRARQNEKQREW